MPETSPSKAANTPRRLFVFNGGLLAKGRQRRILELAEWDVRTGKPDEGDCVGVWGMSPTAYRGEAVASFTGSPIVRVEDAFLRSLLPGRSGEPPIGLLIDEIGVHFDSSQPSGLETILATDAFDDTALLDRARNAIGFMKDAHLSKYCAVDPEIEPPDPGFVLVIDQTRGDASIEHGGAISTTFREMLVFARTEHPDAEIIIKSHPETENGHREGYFTKKDETEGIRILRDPVSPWRLFEHARAVYTVSSGLGFEAIMAGHKPRVFGQPFYAGWGLTIDENPVARRERKLTRAQLFAGAMILAPTWYDPFRDRLATLEQTLWTLAAQAQAWRQDRQGWVATNISKRKQPRFREMFGKHGQIQFVDPSNALKTAADTHRPLMIWAGKMEDDFPLRAAQEAVSLSRVEDGFLRSRGLGAGLVPPMSLALDDRGIYYDPMPESRLETLIQNAPELPEHALARSRRLIREIKRLRLTKYNHGAPINSNIWAKGPKILVVGQVEDDASVIKGCIGGVANNLGLLKAARTGVPNGVIIYKPHPDVLGGFRKGQIQTSDLAQYADVVLDDANAADALDEVEAVWTLTSALGFEALLRGLPVTCIGTPFYAGWGLTRDFGSVPGRRTARPSLEALVHATLIDYPRYFDPVTRQPCPVEVIVDRLAEGGESAPLTGRIASIWRKFFPV